jgi:hypothetical protein
MDYTEKKRPRRLLSRQRVPKDCLRCGRSYIPEGAQRYCHDCGMVARREGPRDHYAKNLESFRAKAQRYRSKMVAKRLAEDRERDFRKRLRVSRGELLRLRRPENRLESISHGPEQKQVCLNCGVVLDGGSSLRSLARHIDFCVKKPKSYGRKRKNCQAYRERWKIDLKY